MADRIWEICHDLNIPMQGHCIFWAKDKHIMPWLNALNNDELRWAVIRRAIDVTKYFKGRIEEFDLNNEMIHEQLQKLFPIYFAHPNVEAILMWNFWEGAHWQPQSAKWKKDWTPTPPALAYHDLVFNQWWTQISGRADDNGTFKADAFYGDYTITSNGKTQKVTLSKKDKSIPVTFK